MFYPLEEVEVLEPEIIPAFQVIEPKIISLNDAQALRAHAETYNDPYLYSMAAIAFDSLDMPLSAQRCRDRARHYQEAQS
jgi:hypothetical protein